MSKPRHYPLPRPEEDKRFTFGLTMEVGKLLERHGYPPVTNGDDFVRLQRALFDFVYEAPSAARREG